MKEPTTQEQAAEATPAMTPKLPDGWVLDDDLSQGHIEDYFAAVNGEETTGSTPEEFGRAVRAAIIADWFSKPKGMQPESVRKMKPAVVQKAALAIWAHYAEIIADDPNS